MSHQTTSMRKALVSLRANLQATLRSVIAMERSAEHLHTDCDPMTFQKLAIDVDALRTLHEASTDLLLAVDRTLADVIADSSPHTVGHSG